LKNGVGKTPNVPNVKIHQLRHSRQTTMTTLKTIIASDILKDFARFAFIGLVGSG
jgi:hypothetical protein